MKIENRQEVHFHSTFLNDALVGFWYIKEHAHVLTATANVPYISELIMLFGGVFL